jgi:hypothetical protein
MLSDGPLGRLARAAACGAAIRVVNLGELHRREYGCLLASLIRVVKDSDLAEDALQRGWDSCREKRSETSGHRAEEHASAQNFSISPKICDEHPLGLPIRLSIRDLPQYSRRENRDFRCVPYIAVDAALELADTGPPPSLVGQRRPDTKRKLFL